MLGNAATSTVLEASTSQALRAVLSAQVIGELTALCYPSGSDDPAPVELAGFLFGTFADNMVQVQTVRQLPLESAGPVFERFTGKQFEELMQSALAEPSLQGMRILGWYRFHLGRDLRLDATEIEFHNRFFTKHEHLGLVLRAEEHSGLGALVCARSQDGTFSRTQHSSASITVNSRRIARVVVEMQAGAKFSEEAYIQAYRILDRDAQTESKRKWILASAGGVLILLVGFFVLSKLFFETAPSPAPETKAVPALTLALSADGPNLQVSWAAGDVSPKEVRLKIYDGGSVSRFDLMKNFKPSGSLTVPRRSGNIQAFMSLNDGFRDLQSESSLIDDNFVASQDAHAALASTGQTAADQSELARLRDKNRRLEATVTILRRQSEGTAHRTRH